MIAYDHEHIECVKMLLDKGAQVNMQDKVSGVIIHCVHCTCNVYTLRCIQNHCACIEDIISTLQNCWNSTQDPILS